MTIWMVEFLHSRVARGIARLVEIEGWWRLCPVSVKVRSAMVRSCVWSLVLYGMEWVKLGTKGLNILAVFANDCRRSVLKLRRSCKVRESELIEKTGLLDIRVALAKKTLEWMAKVVKDEVLKGVYEVANDQTRKAGKPAHSYVGEYRRHLLKLAEGTVKFSCSFCGQLCASQCGLKLHITRNHVAASRTSTRIRTTTEKIAAEEPKVRNGRDGCVEGGDVFTCNVCCKFFVTKRGLAVHSRVHRVGVVVFSGTSLSGL